MSKQIDDVTRQEMERERVRRQIEEVHRRTSSMRAAVKEIVALVEEGKTSAQH